MQSAEFLHINTHFYTDDQSRPRQDTLNRSCTSVGYLYSVQTEQCNVCYSVLLIMCNWQTLCDLYTYIDMQVAALLCIILAQNSF